MSAVYCGVMEIPSASMRNLAQRLLTLEASGSSLSSSHAHHAVRVCEKLRVSLTRVAGPDGFAALMRRALALAKAEVPLLHGVRLKADGSLEGLEEVAADGVSDGAEAALAITTHLLGLLVTFIGEPIMLRLVREAWPDVTLDE